MPQAPSRLITHKTSAARRATWLAVALLALACATTPTGRKQLLLVPDDQMDSMGEAAFQQMLQEEPIERDPATNRFVRCVAGALTAQVESDQDWQVVVFAAPDVVNAFALPGGKIGVYTGLLSVAETQDQLAAVVGHEIAHVLARHGGERVSQQLALGVGLEAVSAAMGNAQSRAVVMGALGLGSQVGILLPYSRKHESEADELGQILMAKAGFDPRASVTLWKRMAEAGGDQPPEFMSTHPAHETRIKRLSRNMDDALAIYREARRTGQSPRCGRPSAT